MGSFHSIFFFLTWIYVLIFLFSSPPTLLTTKKRIKSQKKYQNMIMSHLSHLPSWNNLVDHTIHLHSLSPPHLLPTNNSLLSTLLCHIYVSFYLPSTISFTISSFNQTDLNLPKLRKIEQIEWLPLHYHITHKFTHLSF